MDIGFDTPDEAHEFFAAYAPKQLTQVTCISAVIPELESTCPNHFLFFTFMNAHGFAFAAPPEHLLELLVKNPKAVAYARDVAACIEPLQGLHRYYAPLE